MQTAIKNFTILFYPILHIKHIQDYITAGFFTITNILLIIYLSSCTYNISMVHTEGTASDVIDETTDQTADVKPNLTIPLKGI